MVSGERILNRHWPALLILVVGAIARIWWLSEVNTQPQTDFAWYLQRATDISHFMGYRTERGPTAYWPVGYPLILAIVFKIFGSGLWIAKIFNCLLTLFAAYLTGAITHRLTGSKKLSSFTGLIVALSPGMIAYSGIIASEPLYTALTLLAVHLALWSQSYVRWGFTGFWIGLATLVRPQAILIPFALAAVPRPEAEYRRPKLPFAIAICLGAALLTVTPWIIRNARTHGHFVFISANGGDNLWIGHNPNATGAYQTPPGKPDTPANEVANDQSTKSQATTEIKSNLGRSLSLVPAKIKATFATPTDITYWAFQTNSEKLISPGMDKQRELFLTFRTYTNIFTGTLLFAMFLGLAVGSLTPSGRRLIFIALPQILLTAFVVSVFFGNGRFALPTIPFQAMIAAATLATLRDWVGRENSPDPDRYGYPPEIEL
ncbi:MAG: glycosyltransferase family 39 protein [Fimbriimonadaceae bacterium]|nr:MAG: glycosyltransferase family 39 protein [Fimbriimonadaceae bacterium]